MAHPHVRHPREHMAQPTNWLTRVSDWAATHLAIAFGLAWTVWLFMAVPLLALVLPDDQQTKIFFLSSGWVQLWALPQEAHHPHLLSHRAGGSGCGVVELQGAPAG